MAPWKSSGCRCGALTAGLQRRMDVGGTKKRFWMCCVGNVKGQNCWEPRRQFIVSFVATLADFPSNTQFAAHFPEFLAGYNSALESCQCKFPHRDGSRSIPDMTVGLVDGHCKILIMAAIVCFVYELELDAEDPKLKALLQSFSAIRCSYTHYENPSHHFLLSLRDLDINLQIVFPFSVRHLGASLVIPYLKGQSTFLTLPIQLRNRIRQC